MRGSRTGNRSCSPVVRTGATLRSPRTPTHAFPFVNFLGALKLRGFSLSNFRPVLLSTLGLGLVLAFLWQSLYVFGLTRLFFIHEKSDFLELPSSFKSVQVREFLLHPSWDDFKDKTSSALELLFSSSKLRKNALEDTLPDEMGGLIEGKGRKKKKKKKTTKMKKWCKSKFTAAPVYTVWNSTDPGGVCLDGSPPSFAFRRGHGSGRTSWLIYLEGGAWCDSLASCHHRAGGDKGSSLFAPSEFKFRGILNNSSCSNPYLYNWNIVYVFYCDGGSYSGNIEHPIPYDPTGQGKNASLLFFRGKRAIHAIWEDLSVRFGFSNSGKDIGIERAILSGCSAGGLGAMLRCNDFQTFVRSVSEGKVRGKPLEKGEVDVRCLSDAGFFLQAQDVFGEDLFSEYFSNISTLHNTSFQPKCVSSLIDKDNEKWKCLFPREVVKHVKPPLFLLQSFFDNWQFSRIMIPPHKLKKRWGDCRGNVSQCSEDQLLTLNAYHDEMLLQMSPILRRKSGGAFLNSCGNHCVAKSEKFWHGFASPLIQKKTPAQAVELWLNFGNISTSLVSTAPFFSKFSSKIFSTTIFPYKFVDSAFLCNPSCTEKSRPQIGHRESCENRTKKYLSSSFEAVKKALRAHKSTTVFTRISPWEERTVLSD